MSLKGLFDNIGVTKIVDNKTTAEIGRVVESADFHTADIINEKRFIPDVDFSKPESFAKYGSAEKYYEDSYTYIHSLYPYDGSLAEKLQWRNSGSYIDIHLFENDYPRTNGYINFSYGGWGSHGDAPVLGTNAGYGRPQTSDLEYIALKGGPGLGGGIQEQTANVWDPTNNRDSNLEVDPTEGVTVEFWLNKEAFTTTNTEKEVVVDIWNNELSSSDSYGRLRLELTGASGLDTNWLVTLQSGTTGVQWQQLGDVGITELTDGAWHHYAFSFMSASSGILAKSYVDGGLKKTETLGSTGIDKISGPMVANIGALVTSVSGNTYHGLNMTGSGKLSASLDEFRYWKAQRTSEKIGRYWFTQVGGGTNTDLANTDLGVYYKFNEGITGVTATDSTVLDYSGRVTNGTWTGYASGARNTGSAIVLASASATEFLDPIVYPTHPDVVSTLAALKMSGSVHDRENPSQLFSFFPSWMQENDYDQGGELKKLTQIISSYLDTLYLQIEAMPAIHDIKYVSGSTKSNTMGEAILSSHGLLAPELFIDADILEKLGDRDEKRVYKTSLSDIKNRIYQNIYNNLINIYKTKGTRASFRNMLRCFGVDEKIYKLNVYGENVEFKVRDNRNLYSANKRYINFCNTGSFDATVFSSASADSQTTGYLSCSTTLTGGYASTLETYVLFPRKPSISDAGAADFRYEYLTASLFGQHTVNPEDPSNITWCDPDNANFQVYAIRPELHSERARFVLSSSSDFISEELSSSYYDQVYNNSNWVFGVTVKPTQYPLVDYIDGTSTSAYTIEFKGAQVEAGELINSFTVTSSTDTDQAGVSAGFITGSKRVYVGARRENFTGDVIDRSDVRVGFCRYWLNDIKLKTMIDHGYDVQNYGTENPSRDIYLFSSDQVSGTIKAEFKENETLAMNWDFQTVTGSDASGEFVVPDFSSGSATMQASRAGSLGGLLKGSHTGLGHGFIASSAVPVLADYVLAAELEEFEKLSSTDMISVMSTRDDVQFTRESRPINFVYAIEKSMYGSISETMIRMFAAITDFNNIIGEPLNKYRVSYKSMRLLREKFFEKVGNTPDLDKYVEYYKWFDSSLSKIIEQLIPAGASFSKDIRTIVESHVLERSKYTHRYPTVDLKDQKFEASVLSPLPLSPGWQYTHHPINDQENTNANWWKSLASRNKGKLASPDTAVNSNKEIVFKTSTQKARRLKEKHLYRFVTKRNQTIGAGTTGHPNKQPSYVFKATAPYGPVIPLTNIPQNIMLSFNTDLEQEQDILDDLRPGKKKRLGFGIDPRINVNEFGYDKRDGNILAPFSMYSSSVTNGYNSAVNTFYTSSVMLTNLHEDIVYTTDTRPLQGPFTEKFVGGRYYRHRPLNGQHGPLDTREDRAEGFRILLGLNRGFSSLYSGALGIVPPNYPFESSTMSEVTGGFLPRLPTAQRLRDEGSKRPVNIKNILMSTASAQARLPGTILHSKIGNYSKNYQVVQSSARTCNDLFFQDQSFDFALNPMAAAPRTLSPLANHQGDSNTKSMYFDGVVGGRDYINIGTAATWEAAIGGAGADAKPFTVSMWINLTSITEAYPYLIKFGSAGAAGRWMNINTGGSNTLTWFNSNTGWRRSSTTISPDTWYHVVVTYEGGDAGALHIYLNGANDDGTTASASPFAIGTNIAALGSNAGASFGFNGYMDEVSIWDKEFSAGEVATLYNNGKPFNLAFLLSYAPSCISWWRMGDDPRDSGISGEYIYDQKGNNNGQLGAPSSFSPTLTSSASGWGPLASSDGIQLDYALPNRDGGNSNKTIFVNRFSAPGGYRTLSRGYLDPAHEEKSVYSVLPYRNLSVLNYGTFVSASFDESISYSAHVMQFDELDRGLRQRLMAHNARFGYDSVYSQYPAYYKVNRNTRTRIKDSNGNTTQKYDNYFIHHPIPRSMTQYRWITSSYDDSTSSPSKYYGYSYLSGGYFVESLPLISRSSDYEDSTFVYLNTRLIDPVSSSSNILGFSVDVDASASYQNPSYWSDPTFDTQADFFNTLMLRRNGPYEAPSWKQLRYEDHPVVRAHKKNSTLSLRTKSSYDVTIGARRGNNITQFTEPQIYSSEYPLVHKFNLNTPTPERAIQTSPQILNAAYQRQSLKSSYANKILMFANYELNNTLGLARDHENANVYFNRINSMIMKKNNRDKTFAGMMTDIGAIYAQTIYPAAYNSFLARTRSREHYDITDIWQNTRAARSTGAGRFNSQGHFIEANVQGHDVASSIWPLDGHHIYAESLSFSVDDGAGELQNSYSRYAVKYTYDPTKGINTRKIYPAATYNARIPVGTSSLGTVAGDGAPVYAGDRYNMVQGKFNPDMPGFEPYGSGKHPYKTYEQYSEYLRLVGKDYSIVPEFRISKHMEDYLKAEDFDTLSDIDDLLELSGSAYVNSSQDGFFKEYGNSDFMKMFDVVNQEYSDADLVDGSKMSQDTIALRCNAMLQFLPYKGFYPAERTLELATLFSQSFGEHIFASASGPAAPAVYRAILEPLYSQGIMYNTIKSGIAVSNFLLSQTQSTTPVTPLSSSAMNVYTRETPVLRVSSSLPEGNLYFPNLLRVATQGTLDETNPVNFDGFIYDKVPFEALYQPRNYLTEDTVTGSGFIYDTGLGSASLNDYTDGTSTQNYISWDGSGDKRYELAIDNFMCETVNFFQNGLTTMSSVRSDNFGTMVSGSKYVMNLKLYRPTMHNPQGGPGNWNSFHWGAENGLRPDFDSFDMYRRISAFGPPLASSVQGSSAPNCLYSASFSHLTAPYYAGSGSAKFTFVAPYDGQPTLDEIFSNMSITYDRMETVPLYFTKEATCASSPAGDLFKVQMNDSFNLTHSVAVMNDAGATMKTWIIQSKFETPIINIAGTRDPNARGGPTAIGLIDEAIPPSDSIPTDLLPTDRTAVPDILTQGLWHDYGSIPTGSAGVFAVIESAEGIPDPQAGSLAELVGLPVGRPLRVGEIKNSNRLEEAVVAIPFIVGDDNRRKFYKLPRSGPAASRLAKSLKKYVFPPRFDYYNNRDRDPIAMYVFEFGMDVTQQDIADMWQNLSPSIHEKRKFEYQVSTIQHQLLKDHMLNKDCRPLRKDLRWLIFKVKKRAASDYPRFIKKGLDGDLRNIQSNTQDAKWSYNWPYDYFSLVELVKIDEAIEYTSKLPADSTVQILGDVRIVEDEDVFEDLVED